MENKGGINLEVKTNVRPIDKSNLKHVLQAVNNSFETKEQEIVDSQLSFLPEFVRARSAQSEQRISVLIESEVKEVLKGYLNKFDLRESQSRMLWLSVLVMGFSKLWNSKTSTKVCIGLSLIVFCNFFGVVRDVSNRTEPQRGNSQVYK